MSEVTAKKVLYLVTNTKKYYWKTLNCDFYPKAFCELTVSWNKWIRIPPLEYLDRAFRMKKTDATYEDLSETKISASSYRTPYMFLYPFATFFSTPKHPLWHNICVLKWIKINFAFNIFAIFIAIFRRPLGIESNTNRLSSLNK